MLWMLWCCGEGAEEDGRCEGSRLRPLTGTPQLACQSRCFLRPPLSTLGRDDFEFTDHHLLAASATIPVWSGSTNLY
jgi:hypothetical protein